MDSQKSNTNKVDLDKELNLVSLSDLLGENFWIPDYQRGYKWTKVEVNSLLDDLKEYFEDYSSMNNTVNASGGFYCLQPLEVFKKTIPDKMASSGKKEVWEVIDGQQRLTTCFLILNYLKKELNKNIELYHPSYQTREQSQEYLENPTLKDKDLYIDFYHIYNANETIKEFFKYDDATKKEEFWKNLLSNKVKFIWYNVTGSGVTPEEKFSDLNVGKIPLTNAELIKALFINNLDDENKKDRISKEWDNFEHRLNDSKFWSFIYGNEESNQLYETRIELLFDIIKKKKNQEDDFWTFNEYRNGIKAEKSANRSLSDYVEKEWAKVDSLLQYFIGWYEDKELFHLIGYLRYKQYEILDIKGLFDSSNNKTDFLQKLKKISFELTFDFEQSNLTSNPYKNQIADLVSNLSYKGKEKDRVRDALLLFNLLTLNNIQKTNTRFSFDEFYAEDWDIEHVRSQTPKTLKGSEKYDFLSCIIWYFTGIDYKEKEIDKKGKEKSKYENDFLRFENDVENSSSVKGQEKIFLSYEMQLPQGLPIEYEVKDIWKELKPYFEKDKIIDENVLVVQWLRLYFGEDKDVFDETVTHGVGNLVLLNQSINRGYRNAFFPIKRKWIYEGEQVKGSYMLPCTRNVFAKSYSNVIYNQMNWEKRDSKDYQRKIVELFEKECEGI